MTKPVTRIQEITAEINSKLDSLQLTSIEIGELLIEANEIMKDEGKRYADFIEYCKLNFSIGKAQVSKLMKVSKTFKDDKRFKGVAMRVLYALATQASEDQLEKAAELAANDSLNTAMVNQLLHPEQPKEPEAPKVTPEAEQISEQETDKSLASIPEKQPATESDVPFDMGDAPIAPAATAAPAPSEPVKQESNESLQSAEIEGLNKTIMELRQIISDMQQEKVKINKSTPAPFLPQFRNACPYAVLGLGQLEAKQITKVKKAFRELIKCGYGNGHEAFELLTKAKDQLLADIEEAKQK